MTNNQCTWSRVVISYIISYTLIVALLLLVWPCDERANTTTRAILYLISKQPSAVPSTRPRQGARNKERLFGDYIISFWSEFIARGAGGTEIKKCDGRFVMTPLPLFQKFV